MTDQQKTNQAISVLLHELDQGAVDGYDVLEHDSLCPLRGRNTRWLRQTDQPYAPTADGPVSTCTCHVTRLADAWRILHDWAAGAHPSLAPNLEPAVKHGKPATCPPLAPWYTKPRHKPTFAVFHFRGLAYSHYAVDEVNDGDRWVRWTGNWYRLAARPDPCASRRD